MFKVCKYLSFMFDWQNYMILESILRLINLQISIHQTYNRNLIRIFSKCELLSM